MSETRPKTTVFGVIELAVIVLLAALIILLAAPVVHDLVPIGKAPSAPADSNNH